MVKTINFFCLPQEKKGSLFKIISISLIWVTHQQAIKFKIQVNMRIFIYKPQSLVPWIFMDITKHARSVLVPTTMFQKDPWLNLPFSHYFLCLGVTAISVLKTLLTKMPIVLWGQGQMPPTPSGNCSLSSLIKYPFFSHGTWDSSQYISFLHAIGVGSCLKLKRYITFLIPLYLFNPQNKSTK